MAKLIDAEERTIDYLFSTSDPYKLDVYQRDYRWTDDGDYKIVTQLLEDIRLHFERNMNSYRKSHIDDKASIYTDVDTNFCAYFLNTIMLNKPVGASNIYIVDGQQRLTTILLILIKLFHIGKDNNSKLNVDKVLGEKIYNEDMAGNTAFKISNRDRNSIIEKIFKKDLITDTDMNNITTTNLKKNYDVISKYFDKYFYDIETGFDDVKYCYYCYFLLIDVLLIEQTVKRQEDVAIIFETANDRGKELEPHEVMKGMLLGVLDMTKKEKCNTIWNEALQKLFIASDKNPIKRSYRLVDDFLRTYFRAKFANSSTEYESFSNKYHRSILSNSNVIKKIDRSNPTSIIQFIENDFTYFCQLYIDIMNMIEAESDIYLASNNANDLGQQFLLILAGIKYNDTERNAKISFIAKKYDQLYTIYQLTCSTDSNKFQRLLYDLVPAIREKKLTDLEVAFNNEATKFLNENNDSLRLTCFNDVFDYKNFKNCRIKGRFTVYLLARVDRYLADILHEPSSAAIEKIKTIVTSGRSYKTGFQIEHMFADNPKIRHQFTDSLGNDDEELYNAERNRLGAVLLLKGNLNDSISNEIYSVKFDSYRNSGFLWNRILTNGIPTVTINSCTEQIKTNFKSYAPNADGLLDTNAIEERQQLLFEIIKNIYCF